MGTKNMLWLSDRVCDSHVKQAEREKRARLHAEAAEEAARPLVPGTPRPTPRERHAIALRIRSAKIATSWR